MSITSVAHACRANVSRCLSRDGEGGHETSPSWQSAVVMTPIVTSTRHDLERGDAEFLSAGHLEVALTKLVRHVHVALGERRLPVHVPNAIAREVSVRLKDALAVLVDGSAQALDVHDQHILPLELVGEDDATLIEGPGDLVALVVVKVQVGRLPVFLGRDQEHIGPDHLKHVPAELVVRVYDARQGRGQVYVPDGMGDEVGWRRSN